MTFIGPRKFLRLSKERRSRARLREEIRRQGFFFVDVPRTSSSSIRSEISEHYGTAYSKPDLASSEEKNLLLPPHLTAVELRDYFGPEGWSSIFSFSIVRNPFDRMVSLWAYLHRKNELPENFSFSDFTRFIEQKDISIIDYPPFFLCSADYLIDENGEMMVSQVARFERRHLDLFPIGERLGIPGLGQRAINGTSRAKDYRSYYTDGDRERIERAQQKDIDLFGYSFE